MYDSTIGRWLTEDPIGLPDPTNDFEVHYTPAGQEHYVEPTYPSYTSPAGWVSSFDRSAGDSNLYRYVKNAPTNYTDPTGNDIFIYTRSVGPFGNVHATVMYFDPAANSVVLFEGGGSGSPHDKPSRHPKVGAHFLAPGQTPDQWYASRYHDRTVSKGIAVKTDKTPAEELAALDAMLLKMKTQPTYQFTGPNSNTWARQFLLNSGFGEQPAPPGALGWDYKGKHGYQGSYFDKYGNCFHEFDPVRELWERKTGGSFIR